MGARVRGVCVVRMAWWVTLTGLYSTRTAAKSTCSNVSSEDWSIMVGGLCLAMYLSLPDCRSNAGMPLALLVVAWLMVCCCFWIHLGSLPDLRDNARAERNKGICLALMIFSTEKAYLYFLLVALSSLKRPYNPYSGSW